MPRLLALLAFVAMAAWLWLRWSRSTTRDDTSPSSGSDERSGPNASATTNRVPERDRPRPAKLRTSQRELEMAKHWSDGEIRIGVEQFLLKVDDGSALHPLARQLAQQPERTTAQVLRMLRDPELQSRLQRRRNGQTPWLRGCILLDAAPAEEHAEFVRRLLDDAEEPIRREGWRQLARIGADRVLAELERGAAESAAVRECLARGLRDALAAGRVSADGRRRVFTALTTHVDPVEFDVLRVLAQLDEERAKDEFAARGWKVG
ncbi:MAG: hypothetical protein U1F60_15455 [Planctomycetota bacterium]